MFYIGTPGMIIGGTRLWRFRERLCLFFHDIGIFGPDYWSARYWTTYYRSDYTGYLLQLPITQETDVRREAEAPTRFSLENRLADGDWTCPVRRVHLRGYIPGDLLRS